MQRFFLAAPPEAGRALLEPEEERHALTVLRLALGDRLLGLDGRGGAWLCAIRERRRDGLELEVLAEEERQPEPGSARSPLPELWLACSLPRGRRREELVERAIPMGLARLTPLLLGHSPPHAQSFPAERFARLARAACKQSARLWLPALDAPTTLDGVLERAREHAPFLLSPLAPDPLATLVAEARRSGEGRIVLLVGPEGGFGAEELARARGVLVREAALGPTLLRVEHAAEAALAIALHAWWSAGELG